MMVGLGEREGCVLCSVALERSRRPQAARELEIVYVDDELIALLRPGLPGVLLAPRPHLEALTTLPGRGADFLAALRRIVAVVQSSYGASGAMIEPTTDVPGASGHICYQVVPSSGTGRRQGAPDPAIQATRIADALRGHGRP